MENCTPQVINAEVTSNHGADKKSDNPGARKCIVLSLIRHGHSDSSFWPNDLGLSHSGLQQAEELAKDWKKVRIDHLYSSPLHRARETALAIYKENENCPEIVYDELLVERRIGDLAASLAKEGRTYAAADAYYGPIGGGRNYSPPDGGESFSLLASRAHGRCLDLLVRHGKVINGGPLEYKETSDSPETLPDGIPHVVIVGHSLFFTELWENLVCNSQNTNQRMSNIEWDNAQWSRHILVFDRGIELFDMHLPGGRDVSFDDGISL